MELWTGRQNNAWQGWMQPATPKLDPKIQSQIESKIIKLVSGYSGNPLEDYDPQDKTKTLFTQGDGMWALLDRSFVKILVKQGDTHYPGEPVGLQSGFKLKIPKLPYKLFGQILNFFRHYVFDLDYKGCTEAMVWVYYDTRTQEYFIEVPKQEVSAAGVKYLFEDQNPRCKEQGVVKVFDIHSHNTMSAFFSHIDDNDEKGWQLYGVIGTIGKDGPENYTTAFRAGVDGYYHNSSYEEMVDPADNTIDIAYPKEWEDKVHMFAPSAFNPISTTPYEYDSPYTPKDGWKENDWRNDNWYTKPSRTEYSNARRSGNFFPKSHTVQGSNNNAGKKLRRIADLAERIMLNLQGLSPQAAAVYLDNNPDCFEILMDLQKAIDHIALGDLNLDI